MSDRVSRYSWYFAESYTRMLNGGTLDGAHLEVTSASDAEPKASVLPTGSTGASPIGSGIPGAAGEISQEDKPAVSDQAHTMSNMLIRVKAAIVAEYLAHGYVLGDHIVERAIEFDRK